MGKALNGERLAPQPSSYLPMVTHQPVASTPGASVHDHDHDHHHHHHHHDHGPGEMPVEGVITSRFGLRSDPFHGKTRHHKGLDIAAPTGTPIHPVRPGTVVSSGERGGYGNVVVLDHGDGTTGLYAHCHELKVKKGDKVGYGDVIATVGRLVALRDRTFTRSPSGWRCRSDGNWKRRFETQTIWSVGRTSKKFFLQNSPYRPKRMRRKGS